MANKSSTIRPKDIDKTIKQLVGFNMLSGYQEHIKKLVAYVEELEQFKADIELILSDDRK